MIPLSHEGAQQSREFPIVNIAILQWSLRDCCYV